VPLPSESFAPASASVQSPFVLRYHLDRISSYEENASRFVISSVNQKLRPANSYFSYPADARRCEERSLRGELVWSRGSMCARCHSAAAPGLNPHANFAMYIRRSLGSSNKQFWKLPQVETSQPDVTVQRSAQQGAANRKVAATNMNRESSRSHSVFTCVVESKVIHYGHASKGTTNRQLILVFFVKFIQAAQLTSWLCLYRSSALT
jgi:hypothetical protein